MNYFIEIILKDYELKVKNYLYDGDLKSLKTIMALKNIKDKKKGYIKNLKTFNENIAKNETRNKINK
jgi:hypothetical protein